MSLPPVLLIVLTVLSPVFFLQNTAPAAVVFVTWQIKNPLALAMLLAFALGATVSILTLLPAARNGAPNWRNVLPPPRSGRQSGN